MKYIKYELIVPLKNGLTAPKGLRDRETDRRVFDVVRKALSRKFGGFSEQRITGGYLSDSGEIVYDESIMFSTLHKKGDDRFMKRLAFFVKKHAYQESVYLSKSIVESVGRSIYI